MASLEEKQAILAFCRTFNETIKDPSLLQQVENAHRIIKQCADTRNEIDSLQEKYRHENNKVKSDIASARAELDMKETKLKKMDESFNQKLSEIEKREREINIRDRDSKTREQVVTDRETIHGNNIRALQEREKKVQEKEISMSEREQIMKQREDKIRDAFK